MLAASLKVSVFIMEKFLNRMGGIGGVMLGGAFFMSNFVFIVEPGHRCIIQNNLKGL